MLSFQSELERSGLDISQKLKTDVSQLLIDQGFTLSVLECVPEFSILDAFVSLPSSEKFLISGLYCSHKSSYLQLLGISSGDLSKNLNHPKKMFQLLFKQFQRRIKSSVYCMYQMNNVIADDESKKELILGFSVVGHPVLRTIQIQKKIEEVKENVSFVTLTYLRQYLLLYKNNEMPITYSISN